MPWARPAGYLSKDSRTEKNSELKGGAEKGGKGGEDKVMDGGIWALAAAWGLG